MDWTLRVLREALYLALLLSAPVVIATVVVGFVVGLVQSATQIQDHTLGVVPRIAVAALVLAVEGPWIGRELVRFTQAVLEGFPRVVH